MDNLTSYISNKRSKYKAGSTQGYIDGHIHLFDKYEFLGNLYTTNKIQERKELQYKQDQHCKPC